MAGQGIIRVVLADDHAMVREGLAQILEESGCIRVVGQAANGPEALEVAGKALPEVVVLDYSMPGLDAAAAIEALLLRWPRLKILVLTVHENIHYAVKVLESGAHGYVVKSAAVGELVEAIQAVSSGECYISPKVSQRVIQHLRRPKRDRVGLGALSQREFELLSVLGSGMSLKECARHLNISTSSASTYRARLMEKLNLHSTAEVIRFALENDIVG
ncbi:MAG TPA: response regulator transcription factor [Gemmataceae bacterium]|jgi:DNA-binding NarL/FixJ family response regulator|nr:response regulator transcription factor [Gemmataceae bacterium]